MTSSRWRKLVARATEALGRGEIQGEMDAFPPWLLKKYELTTKQETLMSIHNPPQGAGQEFIEYRSEFHKRVIFEEFFWLELILAAKKQGVKKEKAPIFRSDCKLPQKLEKSLSFELTGAQKRSFKEIKEDLVAGVPMHRLVQGDVGSGKTLIALMSSLVAIESGFQAALMVPTEILAQQHFIGAKKLLEPLGVRIGFLRWPS